MKKMKLAGLVFIGLILAAAAWFAVDIMIARADTPELVREALKSAEITVKDLSPWQLQALLAVEDPKFYDHHGIDLKTPGAGLTTITQGIAKKLYFKPFRPGIRKLRLMALARWVVDPLVSKDDQLTLFLNVLWYGKKDGQEIIGLSAAARAYYGKTVGQLAETEYLSLIAMINAPLNFHVLEQPEANRERVARIQKVLSGEYQPKGLMDMYYGPLPEKSQNGLAPASYFPSLYKDTGSGGSK